MLESRQQSFPGDRAGHPKEQSDNSTEHGSLTAHHELFQGLTYLPLPLRTLLMKISSVLWDYQSSTYFLTLLCLQVPEVDCMHTIGLMFTQNMDGWLTGQLPKYVIRNASWLVLFFHLPPSSSVYVHVHMCACECVYIHVLVCCQAHATVHVWQSEDNLSASPYFSPFLR